LPRGLCSAPSRNATPRAANATRWKMHSGQGSRPHWNWLNRAKPISPAQARNPSRKRVRNDSPVRLFMGRNIKRCGTACIDPPARCGPGTKNPGAWPGFFDLRRGPASGLLRGGFRTVDQLDVRHRRIVAGAEPALEDAQVTARTLRVTRAELDEQRPDGFLVAQAR